MTKKLCDIKELSSYLRISVSEIRKLVKQNKIPHFRVGNRIKFELNTINLWIEKLEQKESKKSLFY